jgi:Ca-activated chloride channel family protein
MKDGQTQKNYLRVALAGCRPEPRQDRTPVNVAFVIDRSGSMEGTRIAQARAAAIMAVNRLAAFDIASIVIFDQIAEVLVPAQQVTDPGLFSDAISRIGVRGTTAIYDGVMRGSAEVLKFKDERHLNRVVLLSDGKANVGPRHAAEFAELGRTLLAQGISVSTIGLGLDYNEDLMLQLARGGDGNHAFAQEPTDLVNIFNKEFDDVLGSCAQTVSVDIELKPGVRAVRALSRDGTIDGQSAQFRLNQVYQATEHYLLLEVEVDKGVATGEQDLGVVKVAYTQPDSGVRQTLDTAIRGRFSASEAEVKAGLDQKVAEAVLEQSTRARTEQAIALRDQGKIKEANELLLQNASEIDTFAAAMPEPSKRLLELRSHYYALGATSESASAGQLGVQRKLMRQLDARPAGSATRY